MDRSASADAD